MFFSKINSNLQIYKENNVYIWGAGEDGKTLLEYLNAYGILIKAFIDIDTEKCGEKINGVNIILPKEVDYGDDTLIQIGSRKYEKEIRKILLAKHCNYVTCSEALRRFAIFPIYKKCKEDNMFYEFYLNNIFNINYNHSTWDLLLSPMAEVCTDVIVLLMPPKVGNVSVYETLSRYKSKNTIILETWHSGKLTKQLINYITDYMPKAKVKFVTGVRSPIEQNISMCFESAGSSVITIDQDFEWENGGNLEKALEFYVKKNKEEIKSITCIYDYMVKEKGKHYLIQDFFEKQYEDILGMNILEKTFNKDRGWDIIHFGEIEIFIYQIEKLKYAINDLYGFAGISDPNGLIVKNKSENKYYYDYYKEAKKSIILDKKYFEWSMNSPYYKHFYSKNDVEREKNKWMLK